VLFYIDKGEIMARKSKTKYSFNKTQIKNGMIVVLRKDGTYKSGVDRITGKTVNIDKYGNKLDN